MTKGISPLIATVIMVAFIISLGWIASHFITGYTEKTKAEVESGNVIEYSSARLEIERDKVSIGQTIKIPVTNVGDKDLDNLKVIVYNESGAFTFTPTPDSIEIGYTESLSIPYPGGNITKIKVTSSRTPGKKYDYDIPGGVKINRAPYQLASPNNPSNGAAGQPTSVTLNVTPIDPDGDVMNVSFYEYYTGEEWTMFHNFLNHTGYTTNHGVDNINSTEVKTFTTGDDVRSSPAVANGYVYVGSNDNKLYQLNASNVSQKIAEYTTGGDVRSSPAVANGYMYVGSSDGKIYQLNASNISQKIAEYSTGYFVYSSPAVANGYVYIGGGDHKIYQLNASNISQKIAEYSTEDYVSSSPAVANGYVYVGSGDYELYQLNASNVSQKIASFTAGEVESFPAVANGYVYVVSEDCELYQLNASNVSQKIASFTAGWVESSPAVANGYVYVGGDIMYQLNASNISQKIAEYTTGSWVDSSPAVANGYVYVGSYDDKVYQIGTGNNLLGTDTNIPSGSNATHDWSGLDSDKTYYWFVNLTDGEYDTESLIWSFTTS